MERTRAGGMCQASVQGFAWISRLESVDQKLHTRTVIGFVCAVFERPMPFVGSVFYFISSVVRRINPSQSISSTHSMLTTASQAISMHMELMMSTSE